MTSDKIITYIIINYAACKIILIHYVYFYTENPIEVNLNHQLCTLQSKMIYI